MAGVVSSPARAEGGVGRDGGVDAGSYGSEKEGEKVKEQPPGRVRVDSDFVKRVEAKARDASERLLRIAARCGRGEPREEGKECQPKIK